MVKLWEYDEQIERLLIESADENGEISDAALEKLTALEGERDQKALHVAAYIVSQNVEADAIESHARAIQAQADRMKERAMRHRRHAEQLAAYLKQHIPAGTKLRDGRVEIGWRRSTAVRITDVDKLDDKFWRVTRAPALQDIKDALKAGESVDGAELEPRNNLVIR
jgi:hypothetical protein